MHLHQMGIRKWDEHGGGAFGDPRGGRPHNGIDLVCPSGQEVRSPVDGKVTKLGYTYADDLSYRYVEVFAGGYYYRVFYVSPEVQLGDEVLFGERIGTAQNIKRRYPGITPHIHFEIKDGNGEYVDPTPVYWALKSTEDM